MKKMIKENLAGILIVLALYGGLIPAFYWLSSTVYDRGTIILIAFWCAVWSLASTSILLYKQYHIKSRLSNEQKEIIGCYLAEYHKFLDEEQCHADPKCQLSAAKRVFEDFDHTALKIGDISVANIEHFAALDPWVDVKIGVEEMLVMQMTLNFEGQKLYKEGRYDRRHCAEILAKCLRTIH